jgi:hypothetical protein
MADLKEHFFTLGKMSWEVCEMLRTAFSNNTFGRTRLVIDYLLQIWETLIAIMRIQVIPPQTLQGKTWRKFAELLGKNDEVHF